MSIKYQLTVFVHGKIASVGDHELFKNKLAQSFGFQIVDFYKLFGCLEFVGICRVQYKPQEIPFVFGKNFVNCCSKYLFFKRVR